MGEGAMRESWAFGAVGFPRVSSFSVFSVRIDLLGEERRMFLGGLHGAGKIADESEGAAEVSCAEH
jgi:hypothetical protein